MAQGTVKWFSDDKGYGFITPEEGGEDLFVHHTGISGTGFKSLEEGSKVSYEPSQGRKGMQADQLDKDAILVDHGEASGVCACVDTRHSRRLFAS